MKKNLTICMMATMALMLTMTLLSAAPANDTMVKENGTYIVNTTTLGKDVVGYVGTTPLKIYIKKNKIVKIEALKNQETPKYWAKVKRQLLTKWDGMKVKDALKQQVDGVTGATFSTDAVKENVRLGLEYYKAHK
jgi:electron transport complex protein RnfG